MKRFRHALLAGLLLAAAAIVFLRSPLGASIEENLGLALLFTMRGTHTPPQHAVIINIEAKDATLPGLSGTFQEWPRSVYTDLVIILNEVGAKLIVFDIHFEKIRDKSIDLHFAETVKKAGNVILIQRIKRDSLKEGATDRNDEKLCVEILEQPFDPLADTALALAPFPVPKLPVRVNQSWIFKPSAGDVPTLPAVVLQAFALDTYTQLYTLIKSAGPTEASMLPSTQDRLTSAPGRFVTTMLHLRDILQRPELAGKILARIDADSLPASQQLRAIVKMYQGKDSIFINFYGPPATITTVSASDILFPEKTTDTGARAMIKDRVVFVGAASSNWSVQKDGFHTVFSQQSGLDLSGVELAATVFCNLLEESHIKSPPFLIIGSTITACSILACMITFSPPILIAAVVLFLFSTGYLAGTYALFAENNMWLPIVTPSFILPLLAFTASVLYKYRRTHRDKNRIRDALALYLPDTVVTEIAKDLSYIKTADRVLYATCLMTDAENYTALSERLSPGQLSVLMRKYYHCIFSTIKACDGLVCNMIGDSVLALWLSQEPDTLFRKNGCQAALRIRTAIHQFNSDHPGTTLPTRVGLHSGYLLMGNIGAEGHFEYAPIGDIVNTSSRIEALNKQLGTRILASQETVQGLSDIFSRKMGPFLLGGKTKPVTVCELIVPDRWSNDRHRVYFELFPHALELFQARRWDHAIETLQECVALHRDDGPSRFYLKLSQSYRNTPPPETWQGVVRISK